MFNHHVKVLLSNFALQTLDQFILLPYRKIEWLVY